MTETRKLTPAERDAWLKATGQRKTGPHRFAGKACHWPYCTQCGLVALKNDVSRKAASKPCAWEE